MHSTEAELKIDSESAWSLHGPVLFSTVEPLMPQGIKAIEAISNTNSEIKINCRGITTCDSTLLAMFLSWIRCAGRRKLKLQFSALPTGFHSLARLSHVEGYFTQFLNDQVGMKKNDA